MDLANACFLGSTVTSGTARGVVVHTGAQTVFGLFRGDFRASARNELRHRRSVLHMAYDPVHGGNGLRGIFNCRNDQG